MYKTTKQSAIDWQVTKDSKPYAWISNSKTASMYVVTFSEFDGEYKGFRNLTEAKAFATAEVAHV